MVIISNFLNTLSWGDIMKTRFSILLFLLLSSAVICVYNVYGEDSDKDKCIELLSEYGWTVEDTPDDIQKVTIPKAFDKVYENYNEIQKNSGFDLLPYRGKIGTRYTFIITNYPADTDETVYANVIAIDGKAVGGDIMTVSLSGFMHGISDNAPINNP